MDYSGRMLKLWLRLRAAIPLRDLMDRTENLRDLAQAVQLVAVWSIQAVHTRDPVYVGPIVVADVMLAGFMFASAEWYAARVAQYIESSVCAPEMPEFSWGPAMKMVREWCDSVAATDA